MSFACTDNGALAFGNSYATQVGDYFDPGNFQAGQAENGIKNCAVLFYQQIPEKMFDALLAKYVTQMEQQQKGLK